MLSLKRPLILASGSPRRKELLMMLNIPFEVKVKNTDESHPLNELADNIPELLAIRKATAFKDDINNEIIISADTIVIIENEILEKPKDKVDAKNMLSKLSGKEHLVVTGVCILSKENQISFSDETRVTFNELSDQEIEFYIDHYKPYDKAGAYACQEWIGAVAINRFDGSYHNVVGLPVHKVYKALLSFNH
jgi:septum formation protein